MSLFGNLGQQAQNQNQNQNQDQNQQKPFSLFGSTITPNPQPNKPATGGLFGNTATPAQPQQQQQSAPTISLFGSTVGGSQQQQQQQPAASTSLFGSTLGGQQQAQAQPQSNTQNQQQQQQQQQPQSSMGSLFGSFGASLTQNNANSLGASLLGPNNAQGSTMRKSALGFPQDSMLPPAEKTIGQQIETIYRKWSPDSPDCVMQNYFYVAVPPERAPFVSMPPDADERKWEEALRKKPFEGAVPVLAKGFQQLGLRLQMQVEAVKQLQVRLHEMNNSLGAMMQNHELVLSVRAAEARRKHVGLSQRCLSLAIKAQVLSSRGFVLDGAEEELKKKLLALEKGVFDPAFAGREEEIWARMVALRERSRWLTDESEKLGRQVNGENGGLDEEVLKKTKKILSDYDAQLTHLKKELDAVRKEYEEWQVASKPSS